ncbi:DUF5305 domain-containing protein [Clostridium estertheticum]|uniref:DUF5305 family protein n=1 Tax=Clostridium estertheticum TaxID=238834 RepID=UPI0013E95DE0|nr:DUF5305 family protein [Clostridium estertheticum]MBZ9689200.1 DUF5305 domain-containing protein [Clostridium estertheticum]
MRSKNKRKKRLYAMNTYLRLSIIILTVIILIGMSVFLYRIVSSHKFTEEKVSLYSYKNTGNINYEVLLLPNEIYAKNSLGEGNTYITDYIDYINASFKYEFSGERPADIKGDYEIIAVIEGMMGSEKEKKTVWKKEKILQAKTEFNVNDKIFSVQKDVPIKIKEYNDIVQKIIKTSSVNFNTKLTILLNVNLEAKTDKGVIKENLSPSMEIPLNTKFFEIKGNLATQKQAAIEEIKKTPVPINQKMVAITCTAIGICVSALVFMFLFTSGLIVNNPFNKKIKQIFKQHGSRMVAIESDVVFSCESIMKVVTMEDLVRISDDICKPILYRNSEDLKEINKFYVIDDSKIYIFKLEERLFKNTSVDKNGEIINDCLQG